MGFQFCSEGVERKYGITQVCQSKFHTADEAHLEISGPLLIQDLFSSLLPGPFSWGLGIPLKIYFS